MAKQKPKPTGDAVIDAIAIWRYQHCPALSIDVILSRPLDAMRLGLAVSVGLGRIAPFAARNLEKTIRLLTEEFSLEMDAVDQVCRALHARKKGQLKRDKV